jgi:aryl-phospho-beta-D-glucosidase BglC (GH1 family)
LSSRIPIASLLIAFLTLATLLPRTTAHAVAQTISPPNAATLRLPAADFPPGASLTILTGSSALETAIGLHTQPLTAFGAVQGISESAHWTLRWGRHHAGVSIRYVAASYNTSDGAAAAAADARATMWETGRPRAITGVAGKAFDVQQRGVGIDTLAAAANGSVAWEIRLRHSPSIPSTALDGALHTFRRVAGAAASLAARLNPGSALTASPPTVRVAPSGVGPVQKSVSLMSLDGLGAPVALGTFRARAPIIAAKAENHPSVAPAGPVTRYACLGHTAAGNELYNSTAIYLSPVAAQSALTTLQVAEQEAGMAPVTLPISATQQPHLAAANPLSWRTNGETILVFQVSNVVTVLATRNAGVPSLPAEGEALAASIPGPLSARATQIVDWAGAPVTLTGANWYGAEEVDEVPGGLDFQPYTAILQSIADHGFNTVRIPFSNVMVETNPEITAHVNANPTFAGQHALTILDAIVQYAGALGLYVVLDDHRTTPGWSSQTNGLWYDDTVSDAQFIADWTALAGRYAGSTTVVGVDLHNEPHATATWGDGNPATDWRLAAERAGDAALHVNPTLLIVVEGVQFAGNAQSYWWGGNLMNVATAPVVLQYADGTSARDRLVYSIHDYGPGNCGTGCPWFNATASTASLDAIWEQYWGYILDNPAASYAAPIWIGEFGTCNTTMICVQDTTPGSQGQWFSALVQYIASRHLSWSYWSINGTRSTAAGRVYGDPEGYGYLQPDWATPHAALVQGLASLLPTPLRR